MLLEINGNIFFVFFYKKKNACVYCVCSTIINDILLLLLQIQFAADIIPNKKKVFKKQMNIINQDINIL